MTSKRIIIPEIGGERLDIYLSKHLPYSRSKIENLIKGGLIKVDGLPIKPHHKTRIGEKIEVIFLDEGIRKEEIPLDIVYQDKNIIVVNKQAGFVVHPTPKIRRGTLINALLFITNLAKKGGPDRPGIVHRLDKDTSGLIVVAKEDKAYDRLIELIKERKVKRKYIALVWGIPKEDRGTIDIPIGRPKKGGVLMKVYGRNSKEATTSYKVLQKFTDISLLELELISGRTHQIRVHLANIGHPVVGDKSYSKKPLLINRQALHAFSLEFPHPITKKHLFFKTEVPEDIKVLIDSFEDNKTIDE
ncbi:TPA: RluA family pseudouridine synthase [bacterium]|nr:RluA family pseudouridine synthase [bacterium]